MKGRARFFSAEEGVGEVIVELDTYGSGENECCDDDYVSVPHGITVRV